LNLFLGQFNRELEEKSLITVTIHYIFHNHGRPCNNLLPMERKPLPSTQSFLRAIKNSHQIETRSPAPHCLFSLVTHSGSLPIWFFTTRLYLISEDLNPPNGLELQLILPRVAFVTLIASSDPNYVWWGDCATGGPCLGGVSFQSDTTSASVAH
jgi:hypothetical protein